MIASITNDGYIVFDNYGNQTPWDWIDMMQQAFPNTYVGCYNRYENCLWFGEV